LVADIYSYHELSRSQKLGLPTTYLSLIFAFLSFDIPY
jgi:hypothetical protein